MRWTINQTRRLNFPLLSSIAVGYISNLWRNAWSSVGIISKCLVNSYSPPQNEPYLGHQGEFESTCIRSELQVWPVRKREK